MLYMPTWGNKHKRQSGDRSNKGKAQTTIFVVFSVGKARQDKGNSLGLSGLTNSSGFGTFGAISSCLVPGLELIQDRGNVGLVCES